MDRGYQYTWQSNDYNFPAHDHSSVSNSYGQYYTGLGANSDNDYLYYANSEHFYSRDTMNNIFASIDFKRWSMYSDENEIRFL